MKMFVALIAVAIPVFAAMPVAPAAAQVSRTLQFYNRCSAPVRYFIYHQHRDGSWQSHGWYQAAGRQPLLDVLNASRQPEQHSEGQPLYVYAETTSGPTRTWVGRQRVPFNGATYPMRAFALTVGAAKFQFGVNCNTPAPAPSAGMVPSSAPGRTPAPPAARRPTGALAAACPRNARGLTGAVTCGCTAQTVADGGVWGSGPYTADSRICRAALHAGVVGTNGGNVRVRIVPGRTSYSASIRNGVSAYGWGSFGTAYVFDR